MKRGTQVRVTGGATLEGRVIAANDVLMIVQSTGSNVYLRRDPASTDPTQWRLRGLPVTVRAVPTADEHADFQRRLSDLERRTRPDSV